MRRLYHRLMAAYYGWRKRQALNRMRRVGCKHGLNFDRYTDEGMIEGIRRWKRRREIQSEIDRLDREWDEGLKKKRIRRPGSPNP